MSYKKQKKVSISMDGHTIISQPRPISNPSHLVWIASFAALMGAVSLGLVLGCTSPFVNQMTSRPLNDVQVSIPVTQPPSTSLPSSTLSSTTPTPTTSAATSPSTARTAPRTNTTPIVQPGNRDILNILNNNTNPIISTNVIRPNLSMEALVSDMVLTTIWPPQDPNTVLTNPTTELPIPTTTMADVISTPVTSGPAPSPSTGPTVRNEVRYFLDKNNTNIASWMSSIITLGALFGALNAGMGISLFGKKNALCIYGIPFAASWFLIAAAPNVAVALIGRFMTGFFGGIISGTAPSYVCEIATPSLRGVLGSGFQLLLTVGILLTSIISNAIGWRVSSYIFAVPSLMLSLMMFFMPESPTHIIMSNEINEKTVAKAKDALSRLRTLDSTIDMELEQLIQSKSQIPCSSFNFLERIHHSDFFKPFIYSMSLMLLQQLSGINAIMFNVDKIFEKAVPDMDPNLASILFFSAQTIATFIESLIVDRFGRRLLLLISSIGCAVGLGLSSLYCFIQDYQPEVAAQHTWLPLLSLVLYIIAFSIGFAPIPWMMIPEMSPLETRSFITTCATALNWGVGFLITYTFPNLLDQFGMATMYLVFVVCTILGIIFMLICLPETSGRSFDQLRSRYATGWKNSLFSANVSRRLSVSLAASSLNLPANDQLHRVTSM